VLVATQLTVDLGGGGTMTPGRGAAFLVLLAFLASFVLVRVNTRLIRSQRVSWWPGNLETEGGLHIHHLVWGIALLLLSGFVSFATAFEAPWRQITAVGFGLGAGLTLDEFALWLRLEDVYWTQEGRSSVDAVVIAALFAGLIVVGIVPFGLEDARSILEAVVTAALGLSFASLTFLKGRLALGVLALFVPVVGLVCTLRLAKPSSPWARWFYVDKRPDRLARSNRRYRAERRTAVLGRRLADLIGGAPSESS
jgi:hypothetical protein